MRCYGQLVRVLRKTRFYQLPVRIRLSFCPETLKFTVATYKNIEFSQKVVFHIHYAFRLVAREPSNRSLSSFACHTITHWHTDFRSYLDFHKMRDVPGFRSAGHICDVH